MNIIFCGFEVFESQVNNFLRENNPIARPSRSFQVDVIICEVKTVKGGDRLDVEEENIALRCKIREIETRKFIIT